MHTFNVHISTSIDKSHIWRSSVRARTLAHTLTLAKKYAKLKLTTIEYIVAPAIVFSYHINNNADDDYKRFSYRYTLITLCVLHFIEAQFFFPLGLFEIKVFTEMWDNCQVLNIMKWQPKNIVYGSMIGVCGCALCIAQMTKWANKFTCQHHWNIRNGITFAYSDFQQNSEPSDGVK